ncbi:MAG: magnesium transporter CorA family protein [Candidatus Aquicultorales bacterium]
MARSLVFDPGDGSIRELDESGTFDLHNLDRGIVWLDIPSGQESMIGRVKEYFDLHPLAVEATQTTLKLPTPRTEIYGQAAYIRWYYIEGSAKKIRFLPVNIFVGGRYVITVRDPRIEPINELYQAAKGGSFLKEGTGELLYRLFDAVVDGAFPILDRISERMDELEELMFNEPKREYVRDLFTNKHGLLAIHKVLSPQRETINALTRFDLAFMSEPIRPYFHDIFNHLVQLGDIVDTYRDVVNGTMDIYLSSLSNQTNKVIRRLTLVATIFLPLTLLTGAFGMNLPFIVDNVAGFVLAVLGAILFIGVVVMIYRVR